MPLLLGLDLGTSYFKVALFDERGALKGLGRVAVTRAKPRSGHDELPVARFRALLRSGLTEALQQAGARASEIVAVSYSSQANTFVLLDRRDRPLTPFVMWTDERGPVPPAWTKFSQTLRFRRTIGFGPVAPNMAIAKWRWFARNRPRLWSRATRLMTISDYLTFVLTGERAGDASTAALMCLYDLHARTWWPDALDAFGVEAARLSAPLPPGPVVGRTTAAAADWLGVPAGIPFAVGGLDHHIAAIGSGIGTVGDVSISTGTVLAALALVGTTQPRAQCFHGPHTDGRFYRLAYDPVGGGQLENYQRTLAPEQSVAGLIALAASTAPGPQGRAVRTILEKVARTHRTLVRYAAGGIRPRAIVATGGGARSPVWLQIKADILGAPVISLAGEERACLGAAMLAAVAAGLYPDAATAAAAMVHVAQTFQPRPA